MRNPRAFVTLDLSPGTEVVLPEGPSRHLIQVLRLGAGDEVTLFNGDGRDYAGQLVEAQRGRVVASIQGASEEEPGLPVDIGLAIGISKGDRMDYAIQKAVELGVSRLMPLFTERSQVKLDGARLERRMEHWQGIVLGACEQSGRRRIPAIEPARTLDAWFETACPEHGLILDPLADRQLADLPQPGASIDLLVGPEGGLSPAEIDRAKRRGFSGVRLGPRILRTETAPLAAIAVIQAQWGDFRG